MNFLSYWDIFGVVLITIYFILSWLYPKRTQEKPKETSEKQSSSSSYESEDWKTARKSDGLGSEAFNDGQSDLYECIFGTSQSSPFGDSHAETNRQEVSTSSFKLDSSSVKRGEIYHSFNSTSEIGEPCSEKTTASTKSMQDAGHGSNSSPNELLCDTSSKFPELVISPKDVSVLLSEIPEQEYEKIVSGLYNIEDDKKDVPKPVQFEELASKSYMECKRNAEDDVVVEGLPAVDVSGTASMISDFSDNLRVTSEGVDASREIQTSVITSSNGEKISEEVVAEAMDSTGLQSVPPEMSSSSSSLQKEEHLEKFAEDLASTAIETAVDDSVCLNTFAENLSEKIFSDSADNVILEVQASLERQKKEAKMQKELEMEELESLGTCVASEVVNDAVGEAALKKEYMDNGEMDLTSVQEIQPHIGFVVENVVNSAICEAASKLKKDQAKEATAPVSDSNLELDTPELFCKSSENETNNNVEAVHDFVTLPDEKSLKDEGSEVIAEEGSKLESEGVLEFDEPLIEELPVEQSGNIVTESGEQPLKEQQIERLNKSDDQQETDIHVQADTVIQQDWKSVSDSSVKPIDSSAETENNEVTAEEVKTDVEAPVESISTLHSLIEAERNNETNISESIDESKEKPTLEENVLPGLNLDDNIEIPKEKLDNQVDREEDIAPVIPEIKLISEKDETALNNEIVKETSPPSSPEVVTQNQITLRNNDHQTGDGKDGFWRQSLILDLEEDLDFDDSESFDVTSPDLSKEKRETATHLDEDSEDFTDSEEDEIIDHDAEAKLGAVGESSKEVSDQPKDEEFDLYDYEQDFDDDDDDDDDDHKAFEPVFSVDGLCISRKQKKEKPKLKSVGSHYNRAVVLDNGSGLIKLGYAGDRVPRVIQQNVTGMPQRFSMHITGMESNLKDYKKYGNEAVAKAGVMHLNHPMKAGIIESWTDIEEIWEYLLYEELGVEVGDNPVLITEVSRNPKKNREKIAEILFEHLNVPAMYLADQLPLSMYASGMTSGVCLSSGYSCTQVAVVYEGHTLAYTLQQLDIGGGDLTENLKILLRDLRARNFTTSSGWQIVNDIKEKLCFVAKDYEHDIDKYQKNDSLTQYYKLPDGQMVDIGYECMSSVEPLFQPDTLMSANSTTASQLPVHKLIDSAIKRCDPDLQDLCYKHIVLSGGTTLLKGFTSRLQQELHHINHRVRKIRTPEHRRYSPWIGGSILASLPSFDEQYITVDDYGDSGSQIVHRKCF